jgi:hypothetical protein
MRESKARKPAYAGFLYFSVEMSGLEGQVAKSKYLLRKYLY